MAHLPAQHLPGDVEIVCYTGGDASDSPRCAALCVDDSLLELLGGGCLPSGSGVGGTTTTDGFLIKTGGGGVDNTRAGLECIPMGIAC